MFGLSDPITFVLFIMMVGGGVGVFMLIKNWNKFDNKK